MCDLFVLIGYGCVVCGGECVEYIGNFGCMCCVVDFVVY